MRLLCSLEGGQTTESLSQRLEISKTKTEELITFLVETGLCKLSNGRSYLGEQHIPVPANSPFVNRHHTNWRLLAINSLDNSDEEELHFTAPMSISKKDFHIIREKIVKLIQESVAVAKESEAEDVAALTLDFYWPIK